MSEGGVSLSSIYPKKEYIMLFSLMYILTFHGLIYGLAFKPLKYINTIWLGLYVNCQVYLHPIDHRCLTRTQDRKL